MRTIAALACLTLLSACSQPPGQYRIGVDEAYARLAASDFAGFMRERQCGILVHLKTAPQSDHSIRWRILSSGREMVSFTATLIAVSDHETKVNIEVARDGDGTEAYDGTDFYRRPALKQPVRPAIEEQIAAVLEGRAYDVANVTQEPKDEVCLIQRGGLESGAFRFSVNNREGEP